MKVHFLFFHYCFPPVWFLNKYFLILFQHINGCVLYIALIRMLDPLIIAYESWKYEKPTQEWREWRRSLFFFFFNLFFCIKHTDSYLSIITKTESSESDILEYLTIQKGGQHQTAMNALEYSLVIFTYFWQTHSRTTIIFRKGQLHVLLWGDRVMSVYLCKANNWHRTC